MSFGASQKKDKDKNGLATSGLTKETQKLLDDAFKKRGLSLRGKADAVASIKEGGNGWVDRLNTGTAVFHKPSSTHTRRSPAAYKPVPGPPASFSGKRMHNVMPPNERDMFVPGRPAPDRELEKDRCAEVFEHGTKKLREMQQHKAQQEAARLSAAQRKPVDPKEALINELLAECAERTDFLESMRKLGRAAEHETRTKAEISVRMARLHALGVDTGLGEAQERKKSCAPLPPWQQKNKQ